MSAQGKVLSEEQYKVRREHVRELQRRRYQAERQLKERGSGSPIRLGTPRRSRSPVQRQKFTSQRSRTPPPPTSTSRVQRSMSGSRSTKRPPVRSVVTAGNSSAQLDCSKARQRGSASPSVLGPALPLILDPVVADAVLSGSHRPRPSSDGRAPMKPLQQNVDVSSSSQSSESESSDENSSAYQEWDVEALIKMSLHRPLVEDVKLWRKWSGGKEEPMDPAFPLAVKVCRRTSKFVAKKAIRNLKELM